MSGKELYEAYEAYLETQGYYVMGWEILTDLERDAWNFIARKMDP